MTSAWDWERKDVPRERLKFLRETFGLSQRAAGIACGFSGQSWTNYEQKNYLPGRSALVIAMRFEHDGDRARDLAQWLLSGGPMPPRPEPPYPFAARGSARHRPQPDDDSYNRCCMSAERVA